MGSKTGISWTDATWNPVTGCTEVSPGCDNCYARDIATRFIGGKSFPRGFRVTLRPQRLDDPLKWADRRMIFVNSMSDLFHREIPDDYLRHVWDVMRRADRHVYQVLTKRAHRMRRRIHDLHLPLLPHVWLGVSVESQELADNRLPELLRIPGEDLVRFVSAEPRLGPVDLTSYLPGPNHIADLGVPGPYATSIDRLGVERYDWDRQPVSPLAWVITGGESGPRRRPMHYDWARALRDQCAVAGVPFFYKQGNHLRPSRDRVLDGQTHDAMPLIRVATQVGMF